MRGEKERERYTCTFEKLKEERNIQWMCQRVHKKSAYVSRSSQSSSCHGNRYTCKVVASGVGPNAENSLL